MYKNKSKPQLRIGLSRSQKPRPISPVRIPSITGTKPSRTIGLSRTYKTSIPKNIDTLIKSPILNNPVQASTPILATSSVCRRLVKKSEEDEEKQTKENTKKKVTEVVKKKAGRSPDDNGISYSPIKLTESRPKRTARIATPKIKKEDVIPTTPFNMSYTTAIDDVSISYSPLELSESTPKVINSLKPKKLILVETAEVPKPQSRSPRKSPQKKLSTISNASSNNGRKFSRLSLKKSSRMELTDDEASEDEIKPQKKRTKINHFDSSTSLVSNMSECSVVLQRLRNDSLDNIDSNVEHTELIVENQVTDDCNEPEDQVADETNKEQLILDIIKLDQVCKGKQVELDALKQSVIYKKLHSVEELTTEREKWRDGCKAVLCDLLVKLKQILQSELTMEGVLEQLNIPEHIFRYDVESDELM